MDGRVNSNYAVAKQWYGKAIAQRRNKHFERALVCFDRALALAPKEADWWYWKGITLWTLERYDEALTAYDRALALDPGEVDAWYWKGRTFRLLKRDDEALACYEKALGIAPDNADAASERAAALFRLQRYDEALAAYDVAITLAPADDPNDMNYWKGRTLYHLNCFDDALTCFDRALSLRPDAFFGWYWKAATLFCLKRYDEALVTYEHALELNPEHVAAWHWKGMTLRSLKRDEDALACFERAFEIAPDNADAAVERAVTLFRLGRYDEALSTYEAALTLSPADDPHETRYWKARTLQQLNRDEEALAAFDTALALKGSQAQWWIDRALSCDKLKRYDEALAGAERAIALDESIGDGWKLKGYALTGLERYADALAAFEQAAQHLPGDSQIWASKGYCLYHLGRFDDVLPAYDEAMRLKPDDAELRKSYASVASNIRRTTADQRLRLRDGRRLGYLDYGGPDGTPIFCFHGTPGSRLTLFASDDLLKELRIRVIAPERPGYGLSDFQPHRCLLDWPADVEQLADYLGIKRFAVLGFSGGGPYAAACAYAIPQRLTRVGLVSSAAPPELAPLGAYPLHERVSNFRGRYFPWSLFHATSRPSLRSVHANPSRWTRIGNVRVSARARESLKSLVSRVGSSDSSAPLPPVARERVLEPFRQGVRGYAWDGWICAHSWGYRLDDIHDVAVFLWHGEQDAIVPIAAARTLAADIPGCHATFYPDEAHNLDSHMREILTTLISGAESEQSDHTTSDSPQEYELVPSPV